MTKSGTMANQPAEQGLEKIVPFVKKGVLACPFMNYGVSKFPQVANGDIGRTSEVGLSREALYSLNGSLTALSEGLERRPKMHNAVRKSLEDALSVVAARGPKPAADLGKIQPC